MRQICCSRRDEDTVEFGKEKRTVVKTNRESTLGIFMLSSSQS